MVALSTFYILSGDLLRPVLTPVRDDGVLFASFMHIRKIRGGDDGAVLPAIFRTVIKDGSSLIFDQRQGKHEQEADTR